MKIAVAVKYRLKRNFHSNFQNKIHTKQNLESNRLGHIDSPEDDELTSDVTEPFHGESLLEDISSVLSPDLLGLIQDSTITEDTTTLCGDKPPCRKLSSKKKVSTISAAYKTNEPLVEREDSLENSNENPLQFGFENIVFEMDNRCDDQKANEPVRYCSLAQFVEGNDIARTSFKVRYIQFTSKLYYNKQIEIDD